MVKIMGTLVPNSPDHETQLKDTQQHCPHGSTQRSVSELVIPCQSEYVVKMGKSFLQKLRQPGHFVFQDCSTLVKEKCKETEATVLAVSVEETSRLLRVATREVIPKKYQTLGAVVKSLG